MPTPTDLAILAQRNQVYHIRLDLLDTDYITIGEVTGIATSLSYGLTANSDIRANANLTMHVSDPSYLAGSYSNVWLNRLIRIYYGLEEATGETVWYLWGSLLMSENSYTYDETTQELSISLVDMMAAMTAIRGRQIGGYGLVIPEGVNVRNAIISTVALFSPFKQYSVPEFPDTIPYDLEFTPTTYPYDVLSGILSIFPTYEMFYSVDGIFTVQEIPTGIGDSVFADETVLNPLIISERKTSRFSEVRNTTELMGMSLDADYTAMDCTTTGNRYDIYIMPTFEVLEDGASYGFIPNTISVAGQTLKIQDTAAIAIYSNTGSGVESPISAGAMQAGTPYCVRYADGKFYLQGELDIHVIVQEVRKELSPEEQESFKTLNDCRNVVWVINPDSPFAADVIGDIRQVLQGGEYDEIYTTELAFERAKYENWLKTRLQDSVEIQTVLIPWLTVNKKISYTSLVNFKVTDGQYHIDGDGYLIYEQGNHPIRFYTDSTNLYRNEMSTYNRYNPIATEINEFGELLITHSENSPAVYLVQEISHDISQFATNIRAIKFYPHYPF